MVYPTRAQALRLIAFTTFREFTKEDWYGFAGCESENPMMGENHWHGEDILIVLDGSSVNMLFAMDCGGGALYDLNGDDDQEPFNEEGN